MKRKYFSLVISTVLLLALLLCGCGRQDSFMSAVKKGDYQTALDIYERKLAGNSADEMQAQQSLEDYLGSTWDAYVSGELSFERFRGVFRCLQQINDRLWLLPELYWMESDYEAVESSKASFASGTASAESGDYASAIRAFSQVIPEDTENYAGAVQAEEQARKTYLAAVQRDAQAAADSGDAAAALIMIENAQEVLGYSDELQNLEAAIVTRMVLSSMEEASGRGELLDVIRIYEETLNGGMIEVTADMTRLASESKTAFIRTVTDEAARAFGTGKDYEAASAVIRNALSAASFSSELLAELEPMLAEYQSYAPVALTSLEPVRKATYIEVGSKYTSKNTSTDVAGTVYDSSNMIYPYEDGFSLRSDTPNTEDDSAITFMLNYQYSTLSGTVFRPYGTLSCEDWGGNYGRVIIYGDGSVIYRSNDITDSTWDPVPFTLDISGVRELKIVAVGRWVENSGDIGIYERHPKVCLADLMLQK